MVPKEFPVTLWPGVEIPAPAVRRYQQFEITNDGRLTARLPHHGPPLPTEFSIRELLDLRSSLSGPLMVDGRYRRLESDESDALIAFMAEWGHMPESRHGLPASDLGSIHIRMERIAQDFADTFALVDCWLGFWSDDYVEPIYFDGLPELRSGVTGDDVAWSRFASVLTAGLRPIGPRATTRRMVQRPTVDLFCAIAVDLHNLIVTGAPPHRCQNERCPSSGWFVHQRGGAELGQYRSTGVRYCSTRCRSAQGSRESRRKAKQSQEKKP